MNAPANSSAASAPGAPTAYEVACGMLLQDWKILLPLYLLLISPQFAATVIPAEDPQNAILLLLAGRVIDLCFLFLVGFLWLRRLSLKPRAFSFKPLFPLVSAGTALWMTVTIPLAVQFTALPGSIKMMFLVLLIPAILINFRLFFFFVPLLFGQRAGRDALNLTKSFTDSDQYAALKVVLAPAAISLLIPNLLATFSPDERSAIVGTLIDLSAGVFWLLTTYIALGYAFLGLPESFWHAQGLDPYRNARLTTLSMRGPRWLAKTLSPKKVVTIFVLSALVWAGNFLRLSDMPPAATLTVTAMEASGNSLKLTLRAEDATYQFRGFRPIFLALAGPQRGVISKWPETATLDGVDGDVRLGLPLRDSGTLQLDFLTERSAADLVKLEDLYVWYRNVKLAKLDLSKAKLIEGQPAAQAPVNANP
ncbi:MAG: hypothetical protein J0M12_17955 [Deltaproteobacteria bacterium]|nr:hypothetical protein [Deltaproteobacteria bacterium]